MAQGKSIPVDIIKREDVVAGEFNKFITYASISAASAAIGMNPKRVSYALTRSPQCILINDWQIRLSNSCYTKAQPWMKEVPVSGVNRLRFTEHRIYVINRTIAPENRTVDNQHLLASAETMRELPDLIPKKHPLKRKLHLHALRRAVARFDGMSDDWVVIRVRKFDNMVVPHMTRDTGAYPLNELFIRHDRWIWQGGVHVKGYMGVKEIFYSIFRTRQQALDALEKDGYHFTGKYICPDNAQQPIDKLVIEWPRQGKRNVIYARGPVTDRTVARRRQKKVAERVFKEST